MHSLWKTGVDTLWTITDRDRCCYECMPTIGGITPKRLFMAVPTGLMIGFWLKEHMW